MPIRFACPKCRQKLSVSSRKAGTQADCPRCKESITIPTPPRAAPPPAAKAEEEDLEPSSAAADEPPPPEPVEEIPSQEDEQEGFPTFGSFEDTLVVYDTEAPSAAASAAVSDQQDLVTVPRYVLYLQGGLLAIVALASFAIGLLVGGALGGGPAGPQQPQACIIRGTVNYVAGGRNLPDMGAVVAIVPQNKLQPDEKAPIAGLRPDDPTPDPAHPGIAILQQIGGGYTRVDDRGHFEIRVPDRGRYLVLVISRERDVRSVDDIDTQDILKLGPFFENAADLLGKHRYRLTLETIRGDKSHEVLFR